MYIRLAPLVTLIAALSLSACGDSGAGDVAGTYVVDLPALKVQMEKKGEGDSYPLLEMAVKNVAITINADGSYARSQIHGIQSEGRKEVTKGTWKAEGDKYIFTDDETGATPKTLRRDGDALVMSDPKMGEMRFVRK